MIFLDCYCFAGKKLVTLDSKEGQAAVIRSAMEKSQRLMAEMEDELKRVVRTVSREEELDTAMDVAMAEAGSGSKYAYGRAKWSD